MAGITRTIHPVSNFVWAPLNKIAPDMQLAPTPGTNGHSPDDPPQGLLFVDPGGIVLPNVKLQ